MTVKEKLVCGLTPLLLAFGAIWSMWFCVALFIFSFLARHHLFTAESWKIELKYYDLFFSFVIYEIAITGLAVALRIVSSDADVFFPLISDGGLMALVKLVLIIVFFALTVMFSVSGFVGKTFRVPGLLKPFQYFGVRSW